MVGRILKLLTLLAIVVMPLSMTTPATAHAPTANVPMSHCPDQPSSSSMPGYSECMLACSAALPATISREPQPITITCEPVAARLTPRLPGLRPETATPPPKHS